jgi:hypothetical protein
MYMRKPQAFLVSLAILVLGCGYALAQNVSDKAQSAEAAATQGLAILRVMASENARDLGFTSSAEASRATLGTPLSVYNVELAALREFKPGGDAAALLKSVPAKLFPVMLEGSVRSAVRVESSGAGWDATRVGNAGLATAITRARSAFPKPDDPDTALVQVLALNLVFVGQKGDGGWLLAPVIDDPSVKLKVGTAERAADVLARLAPLAARHTGDPT